MLSPELTMKVQEWRRKAQAGTLTVEEQIAAIEALRQGRVGAETGAVKSRTKKAEAKAPVDTKALLAGLMGGGSVTKL